MTPCIPALSICLSLMGMMYVTEIHVRTCGIEVIDSPSSRQHLSYDDSLEDKRENYRNRFCAVLCTSVVDSDCIHL